MAEGSIEIAQDDDYSSINQIIIWLDAHIGKPGVCEKLKGAFVSSLNPEQQTWTQLTDSDIDNLVCSGDARPVQFAGVLFYLMAFDNPYRCYEAFERHRNKHIYFITSGSMGEHIVPMLVENHKELFINPITKAAYYSIYIFCGNINYHAHWLSEVCEYAQAFDHDADLLQRMTRDVADYFVEEGERQLQNALRNYQRSKRVYERYTKLGGRCRTEQNSVDIRIENIDNILTPRVVIPEMVTDNDDQDDVRASEPAS